MENNYGTISDMVIEEREIAGEPRVIAIDAKGLYITTPRNVGNGRSDINRFGVPRQEMLEQLAAEGIDVDEMLAANQHRVELLAVGKTEDPKLNPIKASKRL